MIIVPNTNARNLADESNETNGLRGGHGWQGQNGMVDHSTDCETSPLAPSVTLRRGLHGIFLGNGNIDRIYCGK